MSAPLPVTATAMPATAIPATAVPATAVPANAIPATAVPATAVPATGNPALAHDPVQVDRLRRRIEAFHAAYCDTLDSGRLADWPAYFIDDAFYRIIARENRDLGLPVGLVYCEGNAMLRDRAFAIQSTAMHAPRYLRHFVSNIRIDAIEEDGALVRTRANFLLFQVLMDCPTATLHLIGEYQDVFRIDGADTMRLASRDCVYDNALVDNALVYPV